MILVGYEVAPALSYLQPEILQRRIKLMDHECTLGDYVSADVVCSLADGLTNSGIKLRLELVI